MSHTYIGQCPNCNAYCAAVVDDKAHAKETANLVSKMIRQGLLVTRVEDDFVRKHFSRCDCEAKKKAAQPQQLELL